MGMHPPVFGQMGIHQLMTKQYAYGDAGQRPSMRLEEVASPYCRVLDDSIRIDEFEGISNSAILMLSPSKWPYGDATSFEPHTWMRAYGPMGLVHALRHVRSEFPRGESGIG